MCNVLFRIVQHVCRHILRGICAHGTEFIDLEMRLVDAHTLLPEENRSGGIQFDGNTQDQENR